MRRLSKTQRRQRRALAAVVAASIAALVIALVGWWLWPAAKIPPSSAVAVPPTILQPLVAPRLYIVVLPFANLNNDPEQQYLANAITEDLTTDLSRLVNMLVISRNTAFTYRPRFPGAGGFATL
jgi:fatty acid desaturase